MKKKRLILVTNDDGIRAAGLHALVKVAMEFGDVVVVTPDRNNSGKAHSVTFKYPVFIREFDGIPGVRMYTCSGTPADCVKIALQRILDRKPDLIVAGINHGSNASINVLYSGTMATVIEGCMHGIPSIAFSLVDHSSQLDFEASQISCRIIIKKFVEEGMPKGTCLNVNIPKVSPKELKGIRMCRQTNGVWKEDFVKREHPRGFDYYWLTGDFLNLEPKSIDTDLWALDNKYVAVVPIQVDMTAYTALKELKNWNYEHENK